LISKARDGDAPRRRRFAIGAALLMLAMFGLLIPRWSAKDVQDARESSPEIVTIERKSSVPHRAPPVTAHRVTAHSAQVPAAHAVPAPAVVHAAVAVATAAPVPKPKPRQATAPVMAQAVPVPVHHRSEKPAHKPAPKAIALAPHAAPVTASGATTGATTGRYSAAQLARIQNDLASAVATAPKANPLAVPSSAAVASTMKEYGPAVGAFSSIGDSRNHHGLCDPVRDWVAGGYDYYYVACNVRFSDGTMQRQSVPWPIRFDPHDDPFNGTAGRDMALAMPLPDWHPTASSYITPELRTYAKDHGISI